MNNQIIVKGAKENNLKSVNVTLPKEKLIVMTGLSGSGKTSLAFDTIYKEGQRRYVESLSSYARQFLGNLEKPNVETIEGLSPAISIDQKTTSKNPRSTVGTVTEIYDYLRLLYARVGTPYCPTHHIPITSQSIEEMTNKISEWEEGTRIHILAPVIEGKKGTHKNVLLDLIKEGFFRVRLDGEMTEITAETSLEKNNKHSIEVVIDRLKVSKENRSRLFDSLETAAKKADGKVIVLEGNESHVFSEKFACPHCDFSVGSLEPRLFSFNAPFGACEDCHGLGYKQKINAELLVPNGRLSILEGAIKGWANVDAYHFKQLKSTCEFYGISMKKPFNQLTDDEKQIIFFGSEDEIEFNFQGKTSKLVHQKTDYYEGVINNLERRYIETTSRFMREWIESLMGESTCPTCQGKKLNQQALSVKMEDLDIIEMTDLSVKQLVALFSEIKLNPMKAQIAEMILKELGERLGFLNNVGLDYLTLSRRAATLSGGESQRIRLATQIGSQLTGVLYVLDEPSIGLHQRDNARLIETLKKMRDLGNTLIVVEHDEETMEEADFIVDVGPGAGEKGGEIVFAGTYDEILKADHSITGRYLSKKESIPVPENRRRLNKGKITLKNAHENNLKNINVNIPLSALTVVTGVSGSGKSSLVHGCLYQGLYNEVYRQKYFDVKLGEIKGAEAIGKIIHIDQSPIGRTPRSNPGTYTGVFDDIRDIFAMTNEAKLRGYQKGRFSFNVKGGRCEACSGDGVIKIEMNFLPDVYVPCEVCQGKRYNQETLQVKFKGKSIADVLAMNIEEGLEFFKNVPKVAHKLSTVEAVGLGYLKIGQPAPTLSGGEAQRVKLAKELLKKLTNDTMYILDEPTTGLHSADVKQLMEVIQSMVDQEATVVIIEHNLDVIKQADYIIDLGPEGGDLGGQLLTYGTPEKVAAHETSYTGKYLKKMVNVSAG